MTALGVRTLLVAFVTLAVCGVAAADSLERFEPEVQPGYRPGEDKDEAGLWMVVNRHAEQLDYSKFVLRQPDLNAYVKSIVCRLAPPYCDDIRVYIVRTPYFNASMRPNGVMEVWSGLLLRMQNEAQLAAVLGHELAHYLRRHSIKNWRSSRNTMDIMAFLSLGLAVAAGPEAANAANAVALAALFQYNRNQEAEADLYGLQMMVDAGYDPQAAAEVWSFMLGEQRFGCVSDYMADQRRKKKKRSNTQLRSLEKKAQRKCSKGSRSLNDILFASHPASDKRMETLTAAAEAVPRTASDFALHGPRYSNSMNSYLNVFAADQLQQHNFGRTSFVLDHLEKNEELRAEVSFYRAEMHRMRAEPGDVEKAISFYQQAIEQQDTPPEAYRGLGFMHLKTGNREAAQAAFKTYLNRNPDAQDRAMIEFYVR